MGAVEPIVARELRADAEGAPVPVPIDECFKAKDEEKVRFHKAIHSFERSRSLAGKCRRPGGNCDASVPPSTSKIGHFYQRHR